jgi:hypothetical protein
MAKFLEATKNIVITDGGVTVVDRQLTFTMEVEELVEGTIRVLTGQDKFICVSGSEGAEISPMALGLSSIRGYTMESDVQVEVREDGAAEGPPRGPGVFGTDNTNITSIKVVNGSGLDANLKYLIWGNR